MEVIAFGYHAETLNMMGVMSYDLSVVNQPSLSTNSVRTDCLSVPVQLSYLVKPYHRDHNKAFAIHVFLSDALLRNHRG
jgi:hypothetical protein